MSNIPGRLSRLIDELIRKGIVKNEDEAIKYIQNMRPKQGDNFIMYGAAGTGNVPVPIDKVVTSTSQKPSDKTKALDRFRNLVDDLIKRGVVQNEDEAYEHIIKSQKFGKDFILKDKPEPSAQPPAVVERERRLVHIPALEPDEIIDASEKGLVKSSRRPDIIDVEFEDNTLKPVVAGERYTYNVVRPSMVEERIREKTSQANKKGNIIKKLLPTLPFLASGEVGDVSTEEPKVPLRRKDVPQPPQSSVEAKTTKEQKTEAIKISPEIKEVFGYQPAKESAAEYLSRLEALQKELQTGITYKFPDAEKQQITQARDQLHKNLSVIQDEFKNALQEAKTEAARKEQATRWGQVMESVGQGLAQIAAGVYGLKHGIDASSGLKFNKNDWQAEFDRILREVEQRRREAMDVAEMKLKEQEANRQRIDEYEKRRYADLREEAKTKYGAHAQELNRLYDITSDIRQRNMAAENRAREFEAEAKLKKALAEEANELKRQLGEARLEAQKLKDEKKKDDTKEKELAKKKSEYDEAMGRLVSGEVDKKEYDVVLGKINQYLFELGATPEQIQEIQESTSGLFKTRSSEQKDLAKELKALERQLKASSPADSGRGEVQIPEGMVLVVDKEGRKGMIPADKLREAEARGYRRVDR